MNNATLNIVVRVAARQAQQQLAATAAATKALGATGSAMGAASAKGFGAMSAGLAGYLSNLQKTAKAQSNFSKNLSSSALVTHGKNLNWVGRQLTFNFTLPLVAAGAALFKFNNDVTRSMTQVRKVYGNLGDDATELKRELDALAISFELLSTRFGVHQAEVINIASAWASAGSAGRGLAENVKATLQVMILGELEAARASEALIAIQAQWRLSTYDVTGGVSQLTAALATMNIVENETGITMEGLIEVFQRASGSARAAGVTIQELAGFAAALVPATGSATQAGNALRTIFSRLQAPTRQTIDLLAEIGFTVSDASWMGATATGKLEMLADKWVDLSSAQRSYASSVIASRWQVSRFDVLMDDLSSKTGYYDKALSASADTTRNMSVYNQELLTVLQSSPRKWDIMTNSIRNSMAKAFLPLMPAIMSVAQLIAQLANSFSNLDPQTQKWILLTGVIVALVGPLLSLAGSMMNLIGVFQAFGKAALWLGMRALIPVFKLIGVGFLKLVVIPLMSGITGLIPVIVGLGAPFWIVVGVIAAAGAAIALILTTDVEEPIYRVMESIARGVSQLPRIFAETFKNVIRVLQQAISIVVNLLSYLNPFARHSPSLVDNVRAGVATILDEYDKLKSIPATVARAMASLGAFQSVASNDISGFRQTEMDKKIADISAVNPEAGRAASAMVDDIKALQASLVPLTQQIDAQKSVVFELSLAYDAAGKKVEAAQQSLSGIQEELSIVSERLDTARSRLTDLSNMPIKGMLAMEDAIFATSMAQKELNLRLLEFEKAGISIDRIRDKWAALNGDIEMLRGKREELRLAGAGSDVLGAYDEQINALEAQKSGLSDSAAEIENIQRELDALDLEGRFLELTQSLTFDPLVRQIEQAVNGIEEMSFEDILADIQEQQRIIGELEPQYDAIVAAEKEAKKVLEQANAEHVAIGQHLDAEQAKLDALEQSYRDIVDLIGEMQSAMSEYLSLAEEAAAAKKEAEEAAAGEESMFAAGEGVNFETDGGTSTLGREGGLAEIEQFNADLEAEIQRMLEEMGNIDLFSFIGDSIDKLKGYKDRIIEWFKSIPDWVRKNWGTLLLGALGVAFAIAFGPAITAAVALLGFLFTQFAEPVARWTYENIIQPMIDTLAQIGGWLQEKVGQPLWNFMTEVGTGIKNIWDNNIYPVIESLGKFMQSVGDAIAWVWREVISPAISESWDIIKGVFDAIVDFIKSYLVPVFQLFQVTVEIAWELAKRVIQVQWAIIKIAFEAMKWGVETFLIKPITDFGNGIKWVFENVVSPAVNWLKDTVFTPVFGAIGVVVSGAWESMKLLFAEFKGMLLPIQNGLKWLYNTVVKPIMNAIGTIFASVWNGVLNTIAAGVNAFISGFNLLAGAVNAVAGLLGIGSRVSTMDHVDFGSVKFEFNSGSADAILASAEANAGGGGGIIRAMASGGVIGRAGGAVAGARALVGEGSNVYPEYVIPTDPRYRQRARGLYSELGHTFGEDEYGYSNMDIFGIGGAIKSGIGAARGAIGSVGGFLKDKAISAIWSPAHWAAQQAVNAIPNTFIKSIGQSVLNGVSGWMTGADQVWNEEAMKRVPPAPTQGAGSWKAIPALLNQMGIPYKILSTYRPGAVTRNTGQPSWHGKDRAIDLSGPSGMVNYNHADMLKINHAIYTAFKPHLQELIYGGPGAKNVFRGADHTFSSALMREHVNHVHAALARGGFVVPRTHGGSLFRIGEGLHNEAVQVTPLNGNGGSSLGGETTIHFHGDLIFPNVENGDDAERFINNLEALAGVKK